MPKSSKVTEYINTLNTLYSQLQNMNFMVKSSECVEILLQSLPNLYDQLIINQTNNLLVDYLNFDDIAAAVLDEEKRRKNKEERQSSSQQVEALVVTRGRTMERGPSGSGSQNHGRSKSRSKKNVKCYNCGKKGHYKKDCWSLKQNSGSQGNVASTSDDGNVLVCEAATTHEGRRRLRDVWIFDSGATFHMTSRREWFHQYESIAGGCVYTCNDQELNVVGVGSIKMKMFDGAVRTIQGVRHVEGMKKNLLSLGQFDDLGCRMESERGIMKIVRGALVIMKGEKIAAKLYVVKGETLLEGEASVASSSCGENLTMIWHQKLGHMSEQGMKILADQKLLPGLAKVSLPFCEQCVTSKQHRLKFNLSNSRSKDILELVHSDVWQAPVKSIGGASYFVSFIDDFSRRCWVYPIKNKSDVFQTFKIFKARVELETGKKIKCIWTDNVCEYTGNDFDNFCKREGIKR